MAKTLGASKLKKKKLDTKPLVGGVQLEYKTIRAQRWVFVNGKEVGTIDPMLSAALYRCAATREQDRTHLRK